MSAWIGEVCKRCMRRNNIGFSVSDEVWAAVADRYTVLCPSCFDELAELKQVRYIFQSVYPVSWSDWLSHGANGRNNGN